MVNERWKIPYGQDMNAKWKLHTKKNYFSINEFHLTLQTPLLEKRMAPLKALCQIIGF